MCAMNSFILIHPDMKKRRLISKRMCIRVVLLPIFEWLQHTLKDYG